MQINCPTCSAEIPLDDINLDRALARCRACNTVFDFSSNLPSHGNKPPQQRRRPPVGLPSNMKIVVDERPGPSRGSYREAASERGDLVIEYRWFEPLKHIFAAFFCLIWNAFLVVWYSLALSTFSKTASGDGGIGFALLPIIFPLLHVAVGVGLTYWVVAGIFNTTSIGVRGDQFFVHHRPIPWPGSLTVPARSVSQIFSQEVIQNSRHGTSWTYNVSAIFDDGTRRKLLTGLSSVDQALFLEQALEERMGIVDVAVVGEVPP